MRRPRVNKLLAVFVALVLTVQGILPSRVLATERTVELGNHAALSGEVTPSPIIKIDGVDKPVVGTTLDSDAVVTTSSGAAWEIPVIWVRDDLQVDRDEADEGHTYLPVLAFFVPDGYALAEDVFTVVLSGSLAELFGTHEIISVYNEATGITYIIPASLKDMFEGVRGDEEPSKTATEAASPQTQGTDASDGSSVEAPQQTPTGDESREAGAGKSLVQMHCAQTARDALSDEDLEWLVELIIDYLEPQAVNLLLNNFPAFNAAAQNGEIGKEISLYVYFKQGDQDGIREHEGAADALAYVSSGIREIDGNLKYCYMLAVSLGYFVKTGEDGKPITDPKTGRYTLVREGRRMEALHNTIVHELFHALMSDYNRTGMVGATDLNDLRRTDEGAFLSKEAEKRRFALRFPVWFIEGSASSVDNVYTLRNYAFSDLRRLQGKDGKFGTGDLSSTYTPALLLDNYVKGHFSDGQFMYNDIGFSSGGTDSNGFRIDTESSNYVTGYLATLYLCELAARYVSNNESSVKVVDGVTTVDSSKLRTGLDNLLRWNHVENKSLDFLIDMISPDDGNGQSIYKNVGSFENLFIKGEQNADGTYKGDNESLQFATSLLNYLLYLDNNLPEGEHPTGSILEDFAKRYKTPLDQSKKDSSDYMKINDVNVMVPSTVKSDTANIGGGKTDLDKIPAAGYGLPEQREAPLPAAANTSRRGETNSVEEDGSTPEVEPAPQAESSAAPAARDESTDVPETQTAPAPEPEPTVASKQEPAPESTPALEPAPAPESVPAAETPKGSPQAAS